MHTQKNWRDEKPHAVEMNCHKNSRKQNERHDENPVLGIIFNQEITHLMAILRVVDINHVIRASRA